MGCRVICLNMYKHKHMCSCTRCVWISLCVHVYWWVCEGVHVCICACKCVHTRACVDNAGCQGISNKAALAVM